MNPTPRACHDFIIVDPNFADYNALFDATHRIMRLPSGEHALRTAAYGKAAAWIINVQLPDITGIELLKLIRDRTALCAVFLVGDVYSLEDELAARSCGATAYFCKPAHAAWLKGSLTRCRSPTIRAGPADCPACPKTHRFNFLTTSHLVTY